METIDDGKVTETKLLVHLTIYDYDNKIHVIWKHVGIAPDHERKRVCLTAWQYSTYDGSITDVTVRKDRFSFTIRFHTLFAVDERTVKITGHKKPGELDYSVKGVGLWWSDILNTTVKTEWRSTNKKFILPYKEVF